MILQALYELAQRENLVPDADFVLRGVAWCVRVARDGSLAGIEPLKRPGTSPTGSSKKPEPVPKMMRVPQRLPSRSGKTPPAEFAVDNPLYALGLSIPAGKYSDADCARRNGLFLARLEDCRKDTGDAGVSAVCAYLGDLASGRGKRQLPDGAKSNDLVALFYELDEEPFHMRADVVAYWRQSRKTPKEGTEQVCLVTGKACLPVPKHPKLKKMPMLGKTGDIALAPCNKPAFMSYGWIESENAPMSEEASEAAMTALNRLLDPNPPKPSNPDEKLPRRNTRLSADTVVCYWARNDGDDIADMLAIAIEVDESKARADPNLLHAMYDGIWKGKRYAVGRPDTFYSLVLSGGQGRATLRDWIETNTQHVVDSLAKYFADLAIVRRTPPTKAQGRHPPGFPLPLLLEAIADPCERRSEGVPASVAATMYRAAIDERTRYPQNAFTRAINRYRLELGQEAKDGLDGWRARNWNDARAAIIKACLKRNKGKEISETMNPTCTENGYLLGQLMAVLERLQNIALDDVNAGVVDRYFSGASAAPKSVFFNLLKNARHHARKARNDGKEAGKVFLLERLIDQLCDQFVVRDGKGRLCLDQVACNGFPAALDQEQQGLFVLGYHQMRKWLWMSKEERLVWEAANPDAPRWYFWNKTAEDTTNN